MRRKVSVIVPVYNGRDYIANCIENLLNQTYDNMEIVMVDDGSTDDGLSICEYYKKKYDKITVIHQDNMGQYKARSEGINACDGEYLMFLDIDDYLEDDAVEKLVALVEDKEPDMVAFGLIEEYDYKTTKIVNKYESGIYDKERIRKEVLPLCLSTGTFYEFGLLLSLCAKMIKKEFYESVNVAVGENITFGEDADVVFQLIVKANNILITDYAPYHYVRRKNSMVGSRMNCESIEALYNDLKYAFESEAILDIMAPQLYDYITFVKLLKQPRLVLGEGFVKGKRVALYAAGEFGQAVFLNYKSDVVLWVDANYERYADLPYKVGKREELIEKRDEYDYIYIAILNEKLCEEIKTELLCMGLDCDIDYYKHDRR